MAKRKFLVSALILTASILLSGCLVAKPADIKTESPDVTLSGLLTVTRLSGFSITTDDGRIIELDSRQLSLDSYAGKRVTITGQYSGTTLFVSKIQ